MTDRMRFWQQASAASVAGALACLLALTALHASLGLPAVHAFDRAVQAAIHAWPQGTTSAAMLALTDIGAVRTFAVALTLILIGLFYTGHKHAVALLSFAITGAFLLNETLKLYFTRPRPAIPWALGDEHTFSFPSGHSFFSVVLYGTLCWLAVRHGRPAWQVVPLAVLLPIAIGTSRIYLGEHWPTDVLAGWLCGTLWLSTVITVDLFWQKHQPTPKPPAHTA